ncbi:MAG: hypothetical protein AAF802_08435 [Planctomycetota bacterium]
MHRLNLTAGLSFALALAILSTPACVERARIRSDSAFETRELDACLAILIDMSGSFSEQWDDRAYGLFMEISEAYFSGAMGSDNRVVISQIGSDSSIVLFEGRPSDLMSRYSSPEELLEFLKGNSSPKNSNVYRSVAGTVDYVNRLDGLSDDTRLMTVVLSDLREGETDAGKRSRSGHRMIESLREYRELGGILALYFVAEDEVDRWEEILDRAGFEEGQFVIENELNATPRLPSFD